MVKIISPIYVSLPRKTKKDVKKALNLNVYRNLHFIVNNQMKQIYKETMAEQLKTLRFGQIELTFVLYKASNRKIDRSNILCIVEKFFCDCLTELGCIPDDNDNYIVSTRYLTGGVSPKNPRCEIIINNYLEPNTQDLFNS